MHGNNRHSADIPGDVSVPGTVSPPDAVTGPVISGPARRPARYFDLIVTELDMVENRLRDNSEVEYPLLSEALRHIVSSGGKRIRPTLVLLSARLFEPGPNLDKLVALAASVEMLHTATLIHDDIIDGALMRRGSPTLHTMWSRGATVLAGDYMFARSASLAAETENVRIVRIFSRTLQIIVEGEIRQAFHAGGIHSKTDYYERIYAKTASLIETSCKSAAVLAAASEAHIQALQTFGHEIGMAFQIVDDVLDFVGKTGDLGKPAGNDLRQGLYTLPVLKYIEMGFPVDTTMDAVLGGDRDGTKIDHVLQRVQDSPAILSAMQEARDFAHRARLALEAVPSGSYRDKLVELSYYITDREV
ncbi:MAG: polyprenyl synthetase family protein [Chloroflexi bacterium]|nr:polyprenyl synthetase family protein [Chloroflexota bacterium]